MNVDTTILRAALIGIDSQIADLQLQRNQVLRALHRGVVDLKTLTQKRKPRKLSAAARKRIADAQRKRWADYRAGKTTGPGSRKRVAHVRKA